MKPFVKWVGGKRAILDKLIKSFPNLDNIDTFIEPMVGGGIVTCYMLKYSKIKNIIINDLNTPLTLTYTKIKNNPKELIKELKVLESEFNSLNNIQERSEYYYNKRTEFNIGKNIESNFIFLNKTCFNGLYRVNQKGEFNSPMGVYSNPKIFEEENILELHKYFKERNLIVKNIDYRELIGLCNDKTFMYIDPPYRPISKTSNFNNYTKFNFTDDNQKELKEFVDKLTKLKTKVLLSNSDPKNTNKEDNFFDDLYKDYTIERVLAPRVINSIGSNRKDITELLIRNY